MLKVTITEKDGFEDLLIQMAAYLGADYEITHTLTTNDGMLAEAVAALAGAEVEVEDQTAQMKLDDYSWKNYVTEYAESGPIEVKSNSVTTAAETPSPTVEGPTCRYCGAPIKKGRKICESRECQTRKQAEYHAAWLAKKNAAKVEQQEPVQEEQPEEESQLASPLAETWPAMTDWLVMNGPLKGTYLATWEALEKGDSGDLAVGITFLQSKDGRNGRLMRSGHKVLIQFATEASEPAAPGAE